MFMPVICQANEDWKNNDGIYAVFDTTQGKIVCRLFAKETPKTVANFVGLAEGTKQWLDPRTGKPTNARLYDGLIFHRVIPNFMIQGGDPLGMGYGGPGYAFEDEFVPSLSFNKPGMLAMANSGPNTNGSQFFITQVPTPWLTGHHTIFGEVVDGMNVVNAIEAVQRNAQDKPLTPVVINHLTIERIGAEYQVAQAAPTIKKVVLIVAPKDFKEEEYAEAKKALETGGFQVVTASLVKGQILGMQGGKAASDALLNDINVDDYAGVVYIGGPGAQVYWSDPKAQSIAKDAAAKQKVIGAIDLAPNTLANAGLLQGKTVTAFPSIAANVEKSGAKYQGKHVIVDGKLITGSGPEAATEFGQAIVSALNAK